MCHTTPQFQQPKMHVHLANIIEIKTTSQNLSEACVCNHQLLFDIIECSVKFYEPSLQLLDKSKSNKAIKFTHTHTLIHHWNCGTKAKKNQVYEKRSSKCTTTSYNNDTNTVYGGDKPSQHTDNQQQPTNNDNNYM